ncbi:MAG: DUF2842 domain-containing protein [Rhodobacteraceae bacterium]|nr:DUF2842 domain-containing protein [Paracoccaceae bacterium]MCY4142002.1 DUF2842 domain-containing protein [Paracoccaceae bacterium]
MRFRFRTRRRMALLILIVWLPVYVVLAITVINMFDRPPVFVEFLTYVGVGVAWALPFRSIFRGVGRDESNR